MKKILITASTLPRWEGDTEPRFVLDFAKAISKKYEITILTPWSEGALEQEILEGINVVRYHYFPIRKWETLCAPGSILGRIKENKIRILLVPFLVLSLIINLIRNLKKFDFVIAHWIIIQGIVQSFFSKPYMLICHGSDVCAMNKGLIKVLKRRALKRAKAVTVVSNELKMQLERTFHLDNILIRPMGIDISDFQLSDHQSASEKFANTESKTILFVGRLDKIKGVEYLIDAMKDIDAKLLIVGDGILREKLENQAKQYGNKIQFCGARKHSELPKIYAQADVFVAPSITLENGATEGFGLVLIEAMASGTPVIATKTGGMKDIVSDGKNGYLIEEKNSHMIADKINLLLNNPDLCEKIRNAAKETASYYDWRNIGNEYILLIEECIAGEG